MAESVITKINEALTNFSNHLVPSDVYLEQGKEAVNTIFGLLQKNSKYSIDRRYISGSAGKKTYIFNSDFDCILFVNEIDLHQIEAVLDDFEDILTLANLPKLDLSSLRKTPYSIQFKYDYFDMDLLPAINMTLHHPAHHRGNPDLGAQQAFETLKKISRDPNKAYQYSSALAESQLRFMSRQSAFIHQLVRICKLWNKSLFIDKRISGRSTIIELIAVYAGQREENRTCEDLSLLSAFQTFLSLIKNFHGLAIEFDFDPLKPQHSLKELKQSGFAERISPYIIEPANPFNNMAKGVKEPQIQLFQKYAVETLRRLGIYTSNSNHLKIPLDALFQPQPTVIPYFSEEQKKFFKSAQIQTEVYAETGPPSPTMVIRNEDKYKSREMQVVLKHFQTLFSVVVQGFGSSYSTTNSSKSSEQIRSETHKRINMCVDTNVLGVEHRDWVPIHSKHEDFEVTFAIPFSAKAGNGEVKFCARISLKSGQ